MPNRTKNECMKMMISYTVGIPGDLKVLNYDINNNDTYPLLT